MSINIIRKEDQARGQFNGGEILERKPIGFPQDGGKLKPYSNLVYWAHAWTEDKESTIGLHPHKGFEIMSFVIRGGVEHFDTGLGRWQPLDAGDAQMIRAGNGISHSERLKPHSAIFQIWADPNLERSLSQPASYADFPATSLHVEESNGARITHFAGNGGPMMPESEGLSIHRISWAPGNHDWAMSSGSVVSAFLISGGLNIREQKMEPGDFVIIQDENEAVVTASSPAEIFVIQSPVRPGYKTYAEMEWP